MVDDVVPRPTLQTERLLLRPLHREDATAVQAALNDLEIVSMTRSFDYPCPLAAVELWIGEHENYWRSGKAVVWGIQEEISERLVGTVGLEISELDHHAELGYWIAKPEWGRGLATEATQRVLAYGFEELGLFRIFAQHLVHNRGSERVMQKLGMSREGLLRKHARKWGEYHDVVVYGVLAGEFEKKSPPGESRQ